MFPHPSIPHRFLTLGLPTPTGRTATHYLAPCRNFATLVAVQKKNSLCEPNLETAQPYDPKGAQNETAGNSEHQVAQHDGITNRTLRAFASVREPSSSLIPVLRHSPHRCFATLVAAQKKNSLCEPNLETTQPFDSKGAHGETARNSGYQVAQHDRSFPRFGPPLYRSCTTPLFPASDLPEVLRHSQRNNTGIDKQTQFANCMVQQEKVTNEQASLNTRLLKLTETEWPAAGADGLSPRREGRCVRRRASGNGSRCRPARRPSRHPPPRPPCRPTPTC